MWLWSSLLKMWYGAHWVFATQYVFSVLATGPQISRRNLAWVGLNPSQVPGVWPGKLKATGSPTCAPKPLGLAWRLALTKSEPTSRRIFAGTFGKNKPSFSYNSFGRRDHSLYFGWYGVRMHILELLQPFSITGDSRTVFGATLCSLRLKSTP